MRRSETLAAPTASIAEMTDSSRAGCSARSRNARRSGVGSIPSGPLGTDSRRPATTGTVRRDCFARYCAASAARISRAGVITMPGSSEATASPHATPSSSSS